MIVGFPVVLLKGAEMNPWQTKETSMDNNHRKHGKYQMVNKTKNCQRKGTMQKQRLDKEKTICSSNMH